MDVKIFEAALARSDTVQLIRDRQRDIERVGGRVEIGRPGPNGMTLARLYLPAPYTPRDFVPEAPFFPA